MIPNLFSKYPIPNHIPREMQIKINEFSKTKNKENFLKSVHAFLGKRYHVSRGGVLINLHKVWIKDVTKLWNEKEHIHCMAINYLLRIMLIKSELFTDEDIQIKLTTSYYVMIHQFVRVKINENHFVDVDPWSYTFGIKYGEHSHGFKVGSLFPKKNTEN